MTEAALKASSAAASAERMAAGLAVSRLRLTEFRSYAELDLELDGRPVVLTGPNGAGKTNLLEALSFLAPGRGLRRARLDDVARRNGNGDWAVAAKLTTPDGPVDVGTGRRLDGEDSARNASSERRIVRIDGETRSRQGALAEVLGLIWLTPEMDRLFLEPAAQRRRFLDRIIYGFDAEHAGRVAAYENVMRQRLRLLREGRRDAGWLGALEASMAERGTAIAAARREIVARLDQACGLGIGPFPRAHIAVDGLVEGWLDETSALVVEDRLRDRLAETRSGDADSGRTSAGPHRSDLVVHYLPKDVPAAMASTGEQKALLIAIVLAVVRLQALSRGAVPILLMDEIAAHLDGSRREALFAELRALGGQAWLTGTDVALFDGFDDGAQFLEVRDARVGASADRAKD